MKQATHKIGKICVAISLIMATVLFSNCKKDEKDPEPEPTPTPAPTNSEKLTGKNYKIVAITVDPAFNDGNANITDWYNSAFYPSCAKDDLTKFNTNGTVTFDAGTVKCTTSEPQTTSGTWAWNTNETILTVTTGTDIGSYNILVNDGNTLKFDATENLAGTNYKFTYTSTKQ